MGGSGPADSLVLQDGYVYWADVLEQTAGVFKLPLDGVDATPMRVVDTPGPAYLLVLDATSAYWVERGDSSIPSSILTVPVGGGTPATVASGLAVPTGLALDATHAYWDDFYSVFAVPLAGGTPQDLADDRFAQSLIVRDSHAYWSTLHALRSLDLSDPAAVPTTVAMSYVLAFAVDATNIYWLTTDENGPVSQPVTLLEAPLAGGPPRMLLEATAKTNMALGPIKVDSSGVYWCDGYTITRVGVDGTGARAVATSKLGIGDFVLGTDDVYFMAQWRDDKTQLLDYGIRKVPKN